MMNEQLKELIQRATTEEHDGFLYFDKKKFAELLLEEMYDFIMDESAKDNGIPGLGTVKQHFGVAV